MGFHNRALAVLLVYVVWYAAADIATFGPRDSLQRHFHTQSDTLYKRESKDARRPYIHFTGVYTFSHSLCLRVYMEKRMGIWLMCVR